MRLERFVESSRRQLEELLSREPIEEFRAQAEAALAEGWSRPFAEALSRPGTSVIAEHKRRSPSLGNIREDADLEAIVRAYELGGAAALSVITEREHWGGSIEDLRAARATVEIPILRKNFTVDPRQVYIAKAVGADAILLVVGSVSTGEISELYGLARSLDLDCIVEVRTEDDLGVALEIDADVIGINNRDLETFDVHTERTFELIVGVPSGKTVVSESGIRTREDIEDLEGVGVDAVLVGEALMRAEDPEATLRTLTDAEEATQA